MGTPARVTLRFSRFEVDVQTKELRRDGVPVKLPPQALRLLEFLANRPGQLVTREEIQQEIWGGNTFVDFEHGTNKSIRQIRDALGDDADRPIFIETIPRRGYRFIAELEPAECAPEALASGEAPPPPGLSTTLSVPVSDLELPQVAEPTAIQRFRGLNREIWGAAALAALAALLIVASNVGGSRDRFLRQQTVKPIQSLAVLPLENLSHDPEQEYFAEGMTDELITALAKIAAVRVVSRTSVTRYKGTKKPLPEIARELGVDAVVEGTVLHAQNRVRITAQLVRASPEEHLWAQQYESSLEEVLSLQDTVAQDVARSIKINLTAQERTQLATARAVDPEAYEAYLKGRYFWQPGGEKNLAKSLEYFQQAIQKDSSYAPAWAGVADAYNWLASWGVLPRRDAAPRARAAAEKALELDSTLAEPLVALAGVKMDYEWDWSGAEQLCEQAIRLSPNSGQAHATYAMLLAATGRKQEGIAEMRRARQADPLDGVFAGNLGWKLYLAHDYEGAEREARKWYEWHPRWRGDYILASIYLQSGRPQQAVEELQLGASETHHQALLELMYLGHALGVTGAREEGRKVLAEMLALSRSRYVPPDYIAMVYEGLGDRDQAIKWYDKAVEERSMNIWILPDQRLDNIRSDPRFQRLVRRMGLPL